MQEPQEISARKLDQLKTMAEARIEMGQATALEKEIPGLVAALEPAPKVEHTNDTGEHTDQLMERARAAVQTARSKTHTIRDGRYVYDMAQRRFLHIAPDGSERTMFRAFEFSFDEQNAALWAFNESPSMVELVGELISGLRNTIEHLERVRAEKHVAIELVNAEGLTSEYVHRLDYEGLIEHAASDATPPGPRAERHNEPEGSATRDAVLHIYPLADEHGDAMISGNYQGLKLLKDRLHQALEASREGGAYLDHGYSDNPDHYLFAADGEQYHLAIEHRSGGCHDPSWDERPEPYFVPRKRVREAGMDV